MKVRVKNLINRADLNMKVKVQKSRIKGAGKGLIATEKIIKGSVVCTYAGKLVDAQDAKYISPTYVASFENGKGFKILGDDSEGDLGMYANAVHPECSEVKQNARFHTMSKCLLPDGRGMFPLVARRDIEPDEEVIVNYGNGYWSTVDRWNCTPHPEKSPKDIARDERAKKRWPTPPRVVNVDPAYDCGTEAVTVDNAKM